MNKPTAFAFMMGNVFTLVSAAAFMGYWLISFTQNGQVNVVGLTVGFCIMSVAWKARRRVRAFPHGNNKSLARYGSVSMAIIVWCGTMGWVAVHPGDDYSEGFKLCCLLWAVASVFIIVAVVRMVWLASRSGVRIYAQNRAEAESAPHAVSVCLPLPSRSPLPTEMRASLPDYAAQCLERS